MTTGTWFGIGLTFILLGVLNWDRAVDASLTWLIAALIGVGTGMAGGAINTWVDRLARKP